MKKKILSAAMALLLLLMAVGCGTTTSSDEKSAPYVPDPTPSKTVSEFEYDDELSIHEFTAEASGYYLLEVWGAQGGDCTGLSKENISYTRYGGKGGYSKGYVWLTKGETVYVCIGGAGGDYDEEEESAEGGYNGGGYGNKGGKKLNHVFGGGGGATHISTVYSNLENLENNTNAVLLVAGGGGGARWQRNMSDAAARFGNGGDGGGAVGSLGQLRDVTITSDHPEYDTHANLAGSQAGGHAFGKGEDSTFGQAGGGGGWYGGSSGSIGAGAGGSGYIGGVKLGEMESGVQQGNGKAVITWAGNTTDTIPEGLTIPQM